MPDPVTLDPQTQNTIPQAPAQDAPAPAPDPTAGLGGGSAPSMDGLQDLARPNSGPPALANQHSTLNMVLKGVAYALAGAAAGGGEKRPGEAAAAGVKTGMGLAQQGKENVRADQATANQTAETQSRVKFQSVQAAEATARAAMYDQQLHNMPQQFQDEHNARTASFMKEMQDMGISPTIVTDNHGTGANAALEQLTASHGGVPHMQIVNLGDKIIGYDLSQLADNNGVRDQVNKISEIQGLGPNAYTGSRWGMIGKEGREQITSKALSFFMPMPTKDTADTLLQQYKNYQQTYAQNPNADPKLKAKLDETVKMLESSREGLIKDAADEAGAKSRMEQKGKEDAQTAAEARNLPDLLEMARNYDADPKDMFTSRNSQRANMFAALHKDDPTWSESKYRARYQTVQDFRPGGKMGDQIQSLNTFAGHAADANQLIQGLRNSKSPLLNSGMNEVAKQFGNDKIQPFQAALAAAKKEYMNFLNQGHVESAEDQKLADKLTDVNSSPASIQATLKQMANTVLIRAGSINHQYKATMEKDYPDMFSPEAAQAMRDLGHPEVDKFGAKAPTAETHVFSVKAWAAANPKGDIEAAKKLAAQQHFTITD